MKNRMKMPILLLLTAVLVLLCATAAAVDVPSNDCFSPGLLRVCAAMADGASIDAQASFSVDKAFYARDVSLLNTLLSGTTFSYRGTQNADRLTISRGDQTLTSLALITGDAGATVEVDGQAYALPGVQDALEALTGAQMSQEELTLFDALDDFLCSTPILERPALTDVAALLEGLRVGDTLVDGYVVTEAFVLKRTLSDDGTRLTRIDITGAFGREGEEPWSVTGYIRQPAGRSPKDTLEITVKQDDANFLELSYSALYENSVTKKDKAGTASVTTAYKVAGKLEGYKISSRLTVRSKNSWTVSGTALSEKITVNMTLTHQDKTPGRRMQRLNDISATLKNTIRITTDEAAETADSAETAEAAASNAVLALSDETTLELVMDSNTFLSGNMQVSMQVGAQDAQDAQDAQTAGTTAAQTADVQTVADAIEQAVQALSARLYEQLDSTARAKVSNGL